MNTLASSHSADFHLNQASLLVFKVLYNKKEPSQEATKEALKSFLNVRENTRSGHAGWTHRLSSFIDTLWKRRMDSWIIKFNEVAFKGANEFHEESFCDKLILCFSLYAKWNDDPKNFAITSENLECIDWENHKTHGNWNSYQHAKTRIEAKCFESEEALLYWEILQTKKIRFKHKIEERPLSYFDEIVSIINNLRSRGINTNELNCHLRSVLKKQLYVNTTQLNELEKLGKFNAQMTAMTIQARPVSNGLALLSHERYQMKELKEINMKIRSALSEI